MTKRRSQKSTETDRQKEIAIRIGSLSVLSLPEEGVYMDVHNRVWEAFQLGREYEREAG
jgi:hypothetical protein